MILVTVLMMILPNVISMKSEEISKVIHRYNGLCGMRPGQGDPTARGAEQKLTVWVTHFQPPPCRKRTPS